MRYRLGDVTWEIVQDGKTLVVDGKLRRFVSPEHAATQLGRLVGDKLAAGYTAMPEAPPALSEPPPPEPRVVVVEAREPALEAAILADPYDAIAYAVYGDWLQRHGDPRGELIALMLGLEKKPLSEEQHTQIRSAVRRLLLAHSPQFYGSLAEHVSYVHDYEAQDYRWRFGFIHQITTSSIAVARDAFAHASGRFAAELVLTSEQPLDLEDLGPPASLRVLDLHCAETVEITPIAQALPLLRRLEITAPRIEAKQLGTPVLERVTLRGTALSALLMHAIAAAVWPRLERLELVMGPGTATIGDLAGLFARRDLLRLTHLRIKRCAFGNDLVDALVAGPLAAQLQVIDLSECRLGDWGAHALARAQMPQLRELKLEGCQLGKPGIAALEDKAKHVITLSQRAYVEDMLHSTADDDDDEDDDDPDCYDDVDE